MRRGDGRDAGNGIRPSKTADREFDQHQRHHDEREAREVEQDEARVPFDPTSYVNFQVLPSPTAEPTAASMNAPRPDQVSASTLMPLPSSIGTRAARR